jgi:hypothetical protein
MLIKKLVKARFNKNNERDKKKKNNNKTSRTRLGYLIGLLQTHYRIYQFMVAWSYWCTNSHMTWLD